MNKQAVETLSDLILFIQKRKSLKEPPDEATAVSATRGICKQFGHHFDPKDSSCTNCGIGSICEQLTEGVVADPTKPGAPANPVTEVPSSATLPVEDSKKEAHVAQKDKSGKTGGQKKASSEKALKPPKTPKESKEIFDLEGMFTAKGWAFEKVTGNMRHLIVTLANNATARVGYMKRCFKGGVATMFVENANAAFVHMNKAILVKADKAGGGKWTKFQFKVEDFGKLFDWKGQVAQ